MSESRRRIGYALAPKLIKSFIQISLVDMLKERGVDLIRIDIDKPLIDQGPFDCIIHKLSSDEWIKQLEEYSLKNPDALIIDRPDAIELLHDRISMLQVVSDLKIPQQNETFGIPKQILIYNTDDLSDPAAMGGLNFPVIAKPMVVDGSAKSHKMSLVFDRDGLIKLKPPIVVQEFVNHGGVIFKVYVVGDYVRCVKRKSLPDISKEKLGKYEGSVSFSQISNTPIEEKTDDNYYEVMRLEDAEMPPLSFITDIARGLGKAMRLNLFNFDVIRDSRIANHYLVIDINYFPGYAKMPSYETVFTDFFCDMIHLKQKLNGDMNKEESPEVGSVCSKVFTSDKEERKLVSNNCSADEELH